MKSHKVDAQPNTKGRIIICPQSGEIVIGSFLGGKFLGAVIWPEDKMGGYRSWDSQSSFDVNTRPYFGTVQIEN